MAHFLLLFIVFALVPHDAFAHGTDAGGGFKAGLLHPVLGLDHLLSMISVGIVSTQIGGRAIWLVPASFVLIMAVGGFFGMQSFDFMDINSIIIAIEQGIIISVIVLGLAIAMYRNVPIWLAMGACAFFGFFHGFAHGVEIPDVMFSLPYIAGFMLSTAALHIFGVGIGEGAKRLPNGVQVLRYVGAAIVGVGLHIEYDVLSFTFGF